MKKAAIIAILFFASVALAAETKEADLAGRWYPASKEQLKFLLQGYLDEARPEGINGEIFAIISPHAGYEFSGPVAAYGFKALRTRKINTVIIIGFAHRKTFDGVSVYDRGVFRTPLGEIPVDAALAKEIIGKNSRIRFYPEAFNGENSVEMQIPFVQVALKDSKIVPMAFGGRSFEDAALLADALAVVLKGRTDCLIVASTDLSHFRTYEEANAIDRHTCLLLEKMNAREFYDESKTGLSELCGTMPVAAVLLTAEKLGFNAMKVLKYANSGDTSGGKDNVVGYVSAVIYKKSPQSTVDSPQRTQEGDGRMLNDAQRKRLLEIARESITSYVRDKKRKGFKEDDPTLTAPMGAFVTLRENGELKGCIGNMTGQGPLYQTIADMAIEAATGDPRFSRLSPQEIGKIDIEISVLSPMKKVSSHEEVKIPGHGVLVRSGFRSGVYLPQVADEAGWNKEEFLTSLCAHKAGIGPDAWKDPATEMHVFTAEVFGEKEKGGGK